MTLAPPSPPSGPAPAGLRVSNADREAVATLLGQHHEAGRLDADELADRLERAYGAKTRADLDTLMSDLPAPAAPQAPAPPGPTAGRPPIALVAGLAVLLAVVAMGLLGARHGPWGAWWLVWWVWLVPFLWRRWTGPRRRERWW